MNIPRMQNLTKELIAIDSVTGGEANMAAFVQDVLAERGMQVRTFEVAGDRKNVLAAWDKAFPTILFNTHLDTVPPQYGPHADERRIYGREPAIPTEFWPLN